MSSPYIHSIEPEKSSNRWGWEYWSVIVLLVIGVIIVIILFFTGKLTKGDDDSGDESSDDSVCGPKPTCINSNGLTGVAQCDAENKIYKCPEGYCDTSKRPQTCAESAQQCQSDGTFKCHCENDPNNKDNPPPCPSGSNNDCQENGWICICNGEEMDKNCENKLSGVSTCNTDGWICMCGVNDLNDPGFSCPPVDPKDQDQENAVITMSCASDKQTIRCQCNGNELPDVPCIEGSQYYCTSGANGWECKNDEDTCGSEPSNLKCGAQKTVCNQYSQEWICSGQCTGQENECDRDPKNPLTIAPAIRAIYSINCATADNIAQCMSDNHVDIENWNGQPLDMICSPTANSLNAYCTRKFCPKPVSIPNDVNSTNFAGCVAPSEFLVNEGKYNYNNVRTTAVPMGSSNLDMGQPFVMIAYWNSTSEYDSTKGQSNHTASPNCSPPNVPEEFQWYLVALKYQDFTGVVIQPAQNFHPFLAWITRTGQQNGTGSTFTPTKRHGGDSIKQPDPETIDFFLLQHLTSYTYMKTNKCHATSGDGGKACDTIALDNVNDDQEKCYDKMNDGNPTGQTACITGSIQASSDKGKYNNLFTFWIWSQNNTSCTETNATTKLYGSGGDDADIHKKEPQHTPRCEGVVTAPFKNTEHRNDVFYVGSADKWHPSRRMGLYHRDYMSKVNIMAVTTNSMLSVKQFWNVYKPTELWPVSYSSDNQPPPYDQHRSVNFVAPLQYGLVKDTTLRDVQLEAYDWTGDNFDAWEGIGIMGFSVGDMSTATIITARDSGLITKMNIKGSMNTNNYPSCSKDGVDNSERCCSYGTGEWNVIISNSDNYNLVVGDSLEENIHEANFVNTTGVLFSVTKNGHIYVGHYYLCIDITNSLTPRFIFVSLQDIVTSETLLSDRKYLCPMWSIVSKL